MNYNTHTSNNDALLPPSPSSSSSSLLIRPTLLCPPSYSECDPNSKDELIHLATTRLRCKVLQHGLTDAKSRVTDLQSELDNLRIELDTTENVLSKFGDHPDDRQLQALERRFSTHQKQLDHILSPAPLPPVSRPPTPPDQANSLLFPPRPEASLSASTFSSTLQRMSSIFRTKQQKRPTKKAPTTIATTTSAAASPSSAAAVHLEQQHDLVPSSSSSTCSSNYDSDTATPSMKEARERRMRRRQRVKQLRQEYQDRLRSYDPNWNGNDDGKNDRCPSTPALNNNSDIAPVVSPVELTQQPSKAPNDGGAKQHDIPLNLNTTTKPVKRRVSQSPSPQSLATTPTKKSMTASTAQPKPVPAQCLCKRKTNKPDPIKHHKAASLTSRTYHSKQPEMAPLETQKHLSPAPGPVAPPVETKSVTELTLPNDPMIHHATMSPTDPLDAPPSPPNVTEWLSQQQAYHLQEEHQQHNPLSNNNNTDDMPRRVSVESPEEHQPSSLYEGVLRDIEALSDFGNDLGLETDITHLLSPDQSSKDTFTDHWQHHPSAFSFYHQIRLCSILANHGMTRLSRTLLDGVKKGLSWCKFLSVLAVALLISLGRGPDHMLLSLDDMDYLAWLAGDDEEEGSVDSYFL